MRPIVSFVRNLVAQFLKNHPPAPEPGRLEQIHHHSLARFFAPSQQPVVLRRLKLMLRRAEEEPQSLAGVLNITAGRPLRIIYPSDPVHAACFCSAPVDRWPSGATGRATTLENETKPTAGENIRTFARQSIISFAQGCASSPYSEVMVTVGQTRWQRHSRSTHMIRVHLYLRSPSEMLLSQ